MKEETLNLENKHLEETLEKLEKAKTALNKTLQSLGAENVDRLQDLRDSNDASATDLLQFMRQLEERNESLNLPDKMKRLEEIEYLKKEPYFARIDLENSGFTKSLYIGKFGFSNTEESVITDWRARVASVYYRYRYPQKNVKYISPSGEIINDLTLKRTFEIDNGELIKFFNNDIQLDESEIIADKISERTGGVLEDIVETIQESQLDIIESDPRQVTIVQGSVGSGKSTVAIHKLSHIFFNYPEIIQPERSILVAKSGILVSYLATLFPKLGIFDINYKTLRELVYSLMFKEDIKIKFDLDKNTDISDFMLPEIDALRDNIGKLHEEIEEKIQEIYSNPDFASLASYVHDSNASMIDNIDDSLEELNEELSYQKERLKDNPNSVRSWIFKDNIQNLRKLIKKLQEVKADIKLKLLPGACAHAGVDLKGELGYKDMLIYLYIHSELIGFNNSMKFQYCVVDEGQDFSPLEYLVLGKLVINGRFCILGDLNQSYVSEGLNDWNTIKEVIEDARNASEFVLDTNYRSTKQIISFANEILSPYTKDYLPKSINRMGPEVVRVPFDNEESMLDSFRKQLTEDMKDLDKSVGVICFNDSQFEAVKDITEDVRKQTNNEEEKVMHLEEHTRISYLPKGVYLTKFENCKGLEFSKIYILGMHLDKVSNFTEAKKAFVAVTRAMNEVVVLES